MTMKVLIINTLSGHLSLVIFAIILSLVALPRVYGVTFKLKKTASNTCALLAVYLKFQEMFFDYKPSFLAMSAGIAFLLIRMFMVL